MYPKTVFYIYSKKTICSFYTHLMTVLLNLKLSKESSVLNASYKNFYRKYRRLKLSAIHYCIEWKGETFRE